MVQRFLRSLRRADATVLFSMLVVVVCVWVFFEVADQVTAQHAQHIDDAIMWKLRVGLDPQHAVGPRWMRGAMRDLTALGSAPVLILFVLAVLGALLVRRQYHAMALLLAATIGGELLNAALKAAFSRPRPDLALHLTEVDSLSFPSGHAMDSAVIYLTLAALLTRVVQHRALKLYFLALAAVIGVLVGVSRVYLGVHYPSDVLAGWSAGLAWATLCWLVASYLQQRGAVEPPE
ncbi:MAG TPA: phosphatase PAP2 family protein [Vicinamibacteria bacterium]